MMLCAPSSRSHVHAAVHHLAAVAAGRIVQVAGLVFKTSSSSVMRVRREERRHGEDLHDRSRDSSGLVHLPSVLIFECWSLDTYQSLKFDSDFFTFVRPVSRSMLGLPYQDHHFQDVQVSQLHCAMR